MNFLSEIFEKYGIKLQKNQLEQFDLYFRHLVEENEKYNLTAITEEKDVALKHFLDSALPFEQIPQGASVVDVGSGAGFPAIPLKIVRPNIEMCLVDSLGKRVTFLNDVISMLNLQNCSAVHSRAEDFAAKHRESFDVAVARAVAPLNTLVEYLLPLVKVGGKAVIYKSSKLDEELSAAENAIRILGGKAENVLSFQIEGLDRKILIIKKISATPKKYPRGQNKPKLSPIQ